MKNKYREGILIFVGIILALLFILFVSIKIPLLIDKYVFGSTVPSNINNENWAGFLGSYVGSILGGIFTLTSIGITIYFQRSEAKKERIFQQNQVNEDRRLSIAPFLVYELEEYEKQKYVTHISSLDEEYNTLAISILVVKNIGLGALTNFQVSKISFKEKKIIENIYIKPGVIEKDKQALILIEVAIKLDELKDEMIIEDMEEPIDSPFRYSYPPEYNHKGGILSFKILYKDLMENEYYQDITIRMSIRLDRPSNISKGGYSKPKLSIDDIGEINILRKSEKQLRNN